MSRNTMGTNFMVEKQAGDGGVGLIAEVKTNPDTFRLYIEWVVLQVTPPVYDVDGITVLTPEQESAVPISTLTGATISFFKKVAGTDFYDHFDINPIKLDEQTSVPVTLIPGGYFRIEAVGLQDGQRIRGTIYSKLV